MPICDLTKIQTGQKVTRQKVIKCLFGFAMLMKDESWYLVK